MPRPIEEHQHKRYLGDGAYLMPGSYQGEIVLTTEDGINEQNRVVLGPDEIRTLADYLRSWGLIQ
jgi:hypothetical protein